MFYFSIQLGMSCHPNWRTHIFQRGRYTTNQRFIIGITSWKHFSLALSGDWFPLKRAAAILVNVFGLVWVVDPFFLIETWCIMTISAEIMYHILDIIYHIPLTFIYIYILYTCIYIKYINISIQYIYIIHMYIWYICIYIIHTYIYIYDTYYI